MSPVPGGPEDHTPPKLVSVTPDTNAVNFHGDAVRFQFDEVTNDRSGPRQDLTGLFLISPRDGEPRINWHRSRIDVQPHGKWRPNTAYSVTMLPGIGDLSGNLTKSSFTLVFSTGPTLPHLGVVGRVFDWSAQRVAPNAIIEAIQHPDSVDYFARADSTGQFRVGPFGPGRYTVIAFVDANKNFTRDPGELWDSTDVTVTNTQPMLEMLAAQRDTIGPAISSVTAEDSLTLRVTLDKPLDPNAPLDTAQFRIMTADSARRVAIAVQTLGQVEAERAARKDSARVADSLATARDTTKHGAPPPPAAPAAPKEPEAPKPSKPAPAKVLLITLTPGSHLEPLTRYRITATDLVNLLGFKGTSSRVFATPKAPAKSDSTKAKTLPDSLTRARPGGPAGKAPPRKSGGGFR